ncbi:MAG TPA: prolyl oligopeptidase family serine peptidase [Trebonia sp.]|jgi:dipeptidyl-peptidase-4|nr:prolyl oligopeptidase family serine peptidase [Trebonia sp.]
MTESFPRQQARTRGFRLGVPRAFQVSADGERVTFLRSRAGDDPVNCLWEADTVTGAERLVADPRALGADEENLPPQERARRERVRETAAGIVSYATDRAGTVAVFALSGQVYAVPLGAAAPTPRLVPTQIPALDPRPDSTGTKVAYVHNRALRVIDLVSGRDSVVAEAIGEDMVTFGLAEFVAAEEMGRSRGYWWSPDGGQLLIARVDESPVNRWYIADPANPDKAPAEVAYPAAGTSNADVSLVLATIARDTGDDAPAKLEEVDWDRAAFPYLAAVAWGEAPLLVVQTRDQKAMRLINAATGAVLREDTDPIWTDIIDGVPAQLPNGDVVWTGISGDTRGLVIAPAAALQEAAPVTPPGLQVLGVLGTDGDDVLFAGATEPTEIGVWRYGPAGLTAVATEPGVNTATAAGGAIVLARRDLASNDLSVTVRKHGAGDGTPNRIASLAPPPHLPHPQPKFLQAGPTGIRTAVLFPSWHQPGTRLPVLMDPYGGPHHQKVMKSTGAFLTSQWLAEQGFAVVVADGRGTGGRGPAWDRAVAGDLATGPLADQVTALQAAAAEFADLDTERVAIRGWSFGGYLSALALLRRPDVFQAAIVGAPVTDLRLYDTHYTERYLGDPTVDAAPYEQTSIINDPERSEVTAQRPMMIIHGLADDNVFVAHSLRLSSALLAAGYPHSVLPLSGVTHMTPQEVVAENMLMLQVDFLKQALGLPPASA